MIKDLQDRIEMYKKIKGVVGSDSYESAQECIKYLESIITKIKEDTNG